VYLALHGTFGLLWVWKSRIFPDKSWERQASPGYGLVIWFGLMLYWIALWLITSGGVQAPTGLVALTISLFVIGVFLRFTTDMQKHTALTLQPERLITTGMLARSRNLDYFGELLIYLALGLLAMHWLPPLAGACSFDHHPARAQRDARRVEHLDRGLRHHRLGQQRRLIRPAVLGRDGDHQ